MIKLYEVVRFTLVIHCADNTKQVINNVNGLKIFRTRISYKCDGSSRWFRVYLNKGITYEVSIKKILVEQVKRSNKNV